MISLVYLSYRPGGIDMLAITLSKQTCKEGWEVVVVDDCPGRVARGEATKVLAERCPLGWHGTSKPHSCQQRRVGIANAMNTGALHARGDWLVYLHDYCLLEADFVERWKKIVADAPQRTLLHGIALMVHAPKPEAPGDVDTWGKNMTYTGEGTHVWKPQEFELFHAGFPVSFVEAINGFDERADACGNWILPSILHQAKTLSYDTQVLDEARMLMVDHRAWDDDPGYDDSTWRIRGEVSVLPVMPRWQMPSPNPWNFKEERSKSR